MATHNGNTGHPDPPNHAIAEPTSPPSSAISPDWPQLDVEDINWEPSVAFASTSIASLRSSNVKAAVPPSIKNAHPTPNSDIATYARDATLAITRFDAELGSEIGPFNTILMRSEAAASSQIEHLTASSKAILMAEAGDSSRRNATEIAANTAAMRAATKLASQITMESIIEMHAALLGPTHPHLTGRFRDELVWIGGRFSSPVGASYVAPQHERVPDLIDDLIKFSQRHDINPFIKAIIAHAQFETIHPFPDGNGRTGRALIHAILRKDQITTNLTVPVSAGMLIDTDRYVDGLTAYRQGDINPIIEHGATSAFRAITNARELAADIVNAQQMWRERLRPVRSDAIAWKIIDDLPTHPILDASDISARYGVSAPTARAALSQLDEHGIMSRANAGRRFRKWIAHDVADALDRFAERAGRRQSATPHRVD